MRQEFIDDPEAQLRAAVLETQIYDHLDDDNLVKQAYERVKYFSEQLTGQIPRDCVSTSSGPATSAPIARKPGPSCRN